jgi:hypothetical protein
MFCSAFGKLPVRNIFKNILYGIGTTGSPRQGLSIAMVKASTEPSVGAINTFTVRSGFAFLIGFLVFSGKLSC